MKAASRTSWLSLGRGKYPLCWFPLLALFACNEAQRGDTKPSPTQPIPEAFIMESEAHSDSRGSKESLAFLRLMIEHASKATSYDSIVIDYPFKNTIFPPEIVAPQILWHDSSDATVWMASIRFDSSAVMHTFLHGGRPTQPPLDSECIRDNNHHSPDVYRLSAHAWEPDSLLWADIKRRSISSSASLQIYGVSHRSAGKARLISQGAISFRVSPHPVGAPIFYRDVPLMPVRNPKGVIQPLSQDAVPLVAWRLRDISEPEAPVVMKHMPTCINCHSFSSDGKTMGMDMDGPQGDKGSYALIPTAKRIAIQKENVFSWNSFNPDRATFGLFSRVSPNGRYVVSAVDEEVHVVNYMDFRFLQTFYPTRGKIAWFDRETKIIKTLPGADNPRYVQCNPVWSPDGKWVAFLRAKARDAFGHGPKATRANDPRETKIQYSLYRVPFNGGKGGHAAPIKGASQTGKSVSFPKYSPDGKWIIFVQAKNGLLLRPDSKLYIIPAQGGEARKLACNLPLMNSWHSWSPNSKWLVWSSKSFSPFTQMFLTHIDKNGNASPAVLIPNSTAANRAVNLPEFVNFAPRGITRVNAPAVAYRVHFDRSKDFLTREIADSAYAEIIKAIALKPDYAENYSTLAFILARQGKVTAAMEAALKAVKLDPTNDWIRVNAGQLLYETNQIAKSKHHLNVALKLNPNNAITHYYLGLALEAENRTKEAMVHYNQALRRDTAYADAYNNRGGLLFRANQIDSAVDNFSRAIAIEPRVAFLHNRAIAYSARGSHDLALDDIEVAARSDPDNGMTWYIKGNTQLRLGVVEDALSSFERALIVKNMTLQALKPYCDILFSMNKHAMALPKLNAILIRHPGNLTVINRRAVIYMRTGAFAKALVDLDSIISKKPDEASAYFNKAFCYEKMGNAAEALKQYKMVLRYAPPEIQQYGFARRRIEALSR